MFSEKTFGNSISEPSLKHKAKLKSISMQSDTGSAYKIYLNSLAASGRKAVTTLLNQSTFILDSAKNAENFNWHQLTYEKLHRIRSVFIECGYSVNTINLAIAAIKGVTKAAFNLGTMNAEDMMRINSVKSLKGNVVRNGRKLINSELATLLDSSQAMNLKSTRNRAILGIGLGAGLRCSEICALDASDVDLSTGILTIKQGKGRKHRQLYLAEEVCEILEIWFNYRGTTEGPLITRIRKDGQVSLERLSKSGLSYILKSLQKLHGLNNFTPHDMRRTFITNLLENNTDLNTVRQLAGHSDVSTTVKYDKREIAWQRKASRAITLTPEK